MYIKKLEEIYEPNIKLRQVFKYRLRSKFFGSDNAIMDAYDNGILNDKDVEMFKFIYEVKIATKEQILKRCPWLDEYLFDKNVKKWVHERYLNVFVLSNEEDQVITDDALKFYTIDFCTITLLSHFVADNDVYNWNPRSLIMPLASIKKILLATDFRIACETKLARQPISFDCYRLFTFGRFRLIPEAQVFMNVAKEDDMILQKPYLELTYTQEDFDCGDKTRVNENLGRYENWLEKDAWKANFKEAPTIWVVTDTAETMGYVQKIVEEMAEAEELRAKNTGVTVEKPFHRVVRVTCKPMFNENLENCFIKYNMEENKWVRTKAFFLAEKI